MLSFIHRPKAPDDIEPIESPSATPEHAFWLRSIDRPSVRKEIVWTMLAALGWEFWSDDELAAWFEQSLSTLIGELPSEPIALYAVRNDKAPSYQDWLRELERLRSES